MKRLLAILLAVLMMLTACSKPVEEAKEPDDLSTEEIPVPEEPPADPPEVPPQPETPPAEPTIPQTGAEVLPVYLLMAAGVLLVFLGLVDLYRGRKCYEEEN